MCWRGMSKGVSKTGLINGGREREHEQLSDRESDTIRPYMLGNFFVSLRCRQRSV